MQLIKINISIRTPDLTPQARATPPEIKYQVEATHEPNQDKIAHTKDQEAHYIIGSNATDLSSREIIQAYKNQSKVERGFRASIRPYVFCLLLFCQKSKAYHRISDGHALIFAYL